jgi:site-specific recombinase XerC
MFRIMFDTGGPRASEVAGILITGRPHPAGTPAGLGIDLSQDRVTVIGKGGKTRTWPIAAKTATAAARWLRVRDGLRLADKHSRLWHTFRSQQLPLTREGVFDIMERRCDQANIPRMHPHQARHFSYHHFLKRGGRLNDAMMLYGWDDDQMPRIYAAALESERAIESGCALAIGDQW